MVTKENESQGDGFIELLKALSLIQNGNIDILKKNPDLNRKLGIKNKYSLYVISAFAHRDPDQCRRAITETLREIMSVKITSEEMIKYQEAKPKKEGGEQEG